MLPDPALSRCYPSFQEPGQRLYSSDAHPTTGYKLLLSQMSSAHSIPRQREYHNPALAMAKGLPSSLVSSRHQFFAFDMGVSPFPYMALLGTIFSP